MEQQRWLQMLRHFIDQLCDRLGRIRPSANLHQLGGALKFVREGFDVLRERRTEKERLPFGRQLADDLPDVRKKTHVEHPVSLVEHQKLQAGEIAVVPAH